MKKTMIHIIKTMLLYLLFTLVLNLICAILIEGNNKLFWENVVLLFCNSNEINSNNSFGIDIVIAIKRLIEGIAMAVLTSFIFSYVLNREVKVIFPDKLVLRRRTSEGSEGKLTLGILIGNPRKSYLDDVKCSVNCTYLKKGGEIEQRNGETYLKSKVEFIQNYYRFSFDIEDFPKKFWQHFLEKDEQYISKDSIIVTIMGKTNVLGGYFRVTKKYGIQDIIVDVHEPEKRFKKKVKNIFNLEGKIKIDWKEFPKSIEASEDDRQDIINELRRYIYNQ